MDALKCQNIDTMKDVKAMYDGFIIGNRKDIYNPLVYLQLYAAAGIAVLLDQYQQQQADRRLIRASSAAKQA